jgi:molybdopterin synthase sulfur carrier subunit
MIRVELPHHLRTLAQVSGAVTLDVDEPVTLRRVLDALEAQYPVLRGTIRDHGTQQRRAFLRFFVCQEDWSHEPVDAPAAGGGGDGEGAAAGDWRDCRGGLAWPSRRTRFAPFGPAQSGARDFSGSLASVAAVNDVWQKEEWLWRQRRWYTCGSG